MTGTMIGASLGGSSGVTFAVPVGQGGIAFKSLYSYTYGYNGIASLSTYSPPPVPATLRGETIAFMYSSEDNYSGSVNYNLSFGIKGMNTTFAVSTIRMGGVDYALILGGQNAEISATTTITNSGGYIIVNWTGHSLAQGEMVYFTTTGSLPGGLSLNTPYYVQIPSTNFFYVAPTPTGTIISYTTAGSGTHTTSGRPYVGWFAAVVPTVGNATGGRLPFNPTISVGSPAVVTSTSHGLTNGKRVMFRTSGSLPGGLTVDTIYYVVNTATNTFNVSATSGGTAINTTFVGSGTHSAYEVVDMKVT